MRTSAANRARPTAAHWAVVTAHEPHLQRLARSVARRRAGIDPEDLASEGRLGLVRAAQQHDPARGEFWPYGRRWALGWMLRGIRRNGLGCGRSLDAPAGSWDGAPSVGSTVSVGADDPGERAAAVEGLLACLDPRHRRIVELCDFRDHRPADVAAVLGLSSARVRVMRRAALARLERAIDARRAETGTTSTRTMPETVEAWVAAHPGRTLAMARVMLGNRPAPALVRLVVAGLRTGGTLPEGPRFTERLVRELRRRVRLEIRRPGSAPAERWNGRHCRPIRVRARV